MDETTRDMGKYREGSTKDKRDDKDVTEDDVPVEVNAYKFHTLIGRVVMML